MKTSFLLSLTVVVAAASVARADLFLLSPAGSVEGQLVNADESPRSKFVVKTSHGATITFDKAQVREVVRQTAADVEYEKLRHEQPDTVDGHMALADWCRDQRLTDERKLHLQRIIEIDPNNVKARSLLGYNKIGGQWTTRQQHMEAMGKVQYKGEWVYPQEIEIMERSEASGQLKQKWVAELRRWRDWIGGDKDSTARANINGISDPAALYALQQALMNDRFDDPRISDDVRVMYVRAVGRIGTLDALLLLANHALFDNSAEVRTIALDLVLEHPHPLVVNFFIHKLRDKDNKVINSAAYVLARFKDPRAVGPLIDALVTTHKFAVTTGNAGGGISAMNGPGGAGLGMGSSTQIVQNVAQNSQVRDALIGLTGVNYDFNVDAWKQWFAGRKKTLYTDSRRG